MVVWGLNRALAHWLLHIRLFYSVVWCIIRVRRCIGRLMGALQRRFVYFVSAYRFQISCLWGLEEKLPVAVSVSRFPPCVFRFFSIIFVASVLWVWPLGCSGHNVCFSVHIFDFFLFLLFYCGSRSSIGYLFSFCCLYFVWFWIWIFCWLFVLILLLVWICFVVDLNLLLVISSCFIACCIFMFHFTRLDWIYQLFRLLHCNSRRLFWLSGIALFLYPSLKEKFVRFVLREFYLFCCSYWKENLDPNRELIICSSLVVCCIFMFHFARPNWSASYFLFLILNIMLCFGFGKLYSHRE